MKFLTKEELSNTIIANCKDDLLNHILTNCEMLDIVWYYDNKNALSKFDMLSTLTNETNYVMIIGEFEDKCYLIAFYDVAENYPEFKELTQMDFSL